jgi:hypothetical protein
MAGLKRSANLETRIRRAFTPGSPIANPRLFSGREQLLGEVQGAFGESGRNVLLYGEYSVGKTSFWKVLTSGRKVVSHNCDENDDFSRIFLDILRKCGGDLVVSERSSSSEYSSGASKRGLNISGKKAIGRKLTPLALPSLNQTFVMEQMEQMRRRRRHVDTIVLDEFEKINDDATREQIAQLVASLATNENTRHITTVLVGIGARDSTLMDTPTYKITKGRYWIARPINRLALPELKDIFEKRQRLYYIKFEPTVVDTICSISSGLPQVAHEIALQSGLTFAGKFSADRAAVYTNFIDFLPPTNMSFLAINAIIGLWSTYDLTFGRDPKRGIQKYVEQYATYHPDLVEQLDAIVTRKDKAFARQILEVLGPEGPRSSLSLAGSSRRREFESKLDFLVESLGSVFQRIGPTDYGLVRPDLWCFHKARIALQQPHGVPTSPS